MDIGVRVLRHSPFSADANVPFAFGGNNGVQEFIKTGII